MKKFLFIFTILLSVFSWNGVASEGMRRCLLLPIQDEVKGAVGFPVYEEIEYYLKNSDWCYYRSNSGIIDILGNYQQNLKSHLKNKDVLKVLADKTRSGSLMRITLENEIEGIRVQLDILGANGEDLYFSEKTVLERPDVGVISRTLKNWLEEYEQVIPYDATVEGVLGDQFTIKIGREYGVRSRDKVKIIRPVQKRKHPLLKEIVEWETEDVATGEIFHSVENQSQGKALDYYEDKKLSTQDWVILLPREDKQQEEDLPYEDDDYRFGKLGRLGLGLALGNASTTLSAGNANTKKIGGFTPGAEIDLELWMTRNYWFGFEFRQTLSTFKQEEGQISQSENSASFNNFKVKFGYKYLPLGFFYGPQVDFYAGYARYGYGLDTSRADGFTEVSFKGLNFGSRGTIPLMKKLKAYLEIEFIFNPGFDEEVSVQGKEDSTSNFHIGFGGIYDFNPKMAFYGGFDFVQSKAQYESSNEELKLKESSLIIGTQFTF